MNKKLIYLLTLVFAFGFAFTACSDDDDDLTLEKYETEVNIGESVTLKITGGNGDYKVSSGDATIATAAVANKEITVTGVKAGETTITVTDKENKSATLKVKVLTYAEQIAATYNGDLSITLPGEQPEVGKKDILLETSGEKTTLTLADFTFATIPVGDIVINDIPLTKTNDIITLVETTQQVSLAEGTITADVTVSGTYDKDGKLSLTINVITADFGNIPILVTFSGTKKESE